MSSKADWRKARLVSIADLNSDVRVFEIAPEGRFLPARAGSHIDIGVQIAGRPAVRSYSTLGPGADGCYRIAVKRLRDSRGGSEYMWSLGPGAALTMAMPANHFELSHGAPHYTLIAGGIGVTPIYSMALALAASGASFDMHYACRAQSDLVLADDLRDRIGERLKIHVRESGQRVELALAIQALPAGGELYVCGPIEMLDEARALWATSGRPIDGLRFETFANSGRFPNAPFSVHMPHIGRSVEVAANQTMLEALEQAGVATMYDCRRGECGLCALNVLELDGVIDHRDVFFSEEEKVEGHKLCACVSRVSGTSITVDTGERRMPSA